MGYRLTADIGGTFTDFVLVDEAGNMQIAKTPSTPGDFAAGVLDGIAKLGVDLTEVDVFVHGATVVLNAILERKLPKTALVTTRGFRDVLEIMRTNNPNMYDLQDVKPAPLVPRALRYEVTERVRHTGEVLAAPDREEIVALAERLRRDDVAAVAVCLLHSYAHPEHERLIGKLLAEHLPGVLVCLSSDVAPEWREYERTSTTVINAASVPVIGAYLDQLQERLKDEGLKNELFVMQSSGGIKTAGASVVKPVGTVMSGPSGGAVGAAFLSQALDAPNIMTIDIGGTTSDMALIVDGEAVTADQAAVERWPLLLPTVDILSIGAGGGSIAWVDRGGALRVGPQSAGALPGPVAMKKGGTEPTVTDANLVLGRIDPDYFLGGEFKLDREAATEAVATKVAEPLGLDTTVAAHGIVQIASTNMARAMRSIALERGFDPRSFLLMGFGGGGGMHTAPLMRELNIPRGVVPRNPGSLSAFGMLVTDFRHDRSRTHVRLLGEADLAEVNAIFAELAAAATEDLERDGIDAASIRTDLSADIRYLGQEHHINIPVDGTLVDADRLSLAERFNVAHEHAYNYATPGREVQIVNLRVTGVGTTTDPELSVEEEGGDDPGAALKGRRPVYFAEAGDFEETRIYGIEDLCPGNRVEGPAVIEDPNSAILVLAGQAASVDRYRNTVIEEVEK